MLAIEHHGLAPQGLLCLETMQEITARKKKLRDEYCQVTRKECTRFPKLLNTSVLAEQAHLFAVEAHEQIG